MIYVDRLQVYGAPRGFWAGRPSCHLFADTLAELHAFAGQLALKPRWFQDRPGFPHYDLTAGKRARALTLGAVEIRIREFIAARREAERGKSGIPPVGLAHPADAP